MDGMSLISLNTRGGCKARMSYMKEEGGEVVLKDGIAGGLGVRGIYVSSLSYWVQGRRVGFGIFSYYTSYSDNRPGPLLVVRVGYRERGNLEVDDHPGISYRYSS